MLKIYNTLARDKQDFQTIELGKMHTNDCAIETMNNPRYPLELFMYVVTASLETMKIVHGLPKLKILNSEK